QVHLRRDSVRARCSRGAPRRAPADVLARRQSAGAPDGAAVTFRSRPQLEPIRAQADPLLEADGSYTPRPDARSMRVYPELDVRLVLEDFFLRLEEFSRWQGQER